MFIFHAFTHTQILTRRLGSVIKRNAKKVFTFLKTPSFLLQSLCITQKCLLSAGQESGYFCWSKYAIFQGITTV